MKKSNAIILGLIILSVSTACHTKKKSRYIKEKDWQNGNSSYVSTDGGQNYYPSSGGVPFWFYYYMMYNSRGGYGYSPMVMYRPTTSFGHSSGYHVSAGGHSYSGGTARGGFGSFGGSVGA